MTGVGTRGRVAFRIVGVLLGLGTLAAVAYELRHTDIHAVLRDVRPGYVAVAVGVTAVSLVAAAYNVIGFSPLKPRAGPTVLAQLAVSAVRVVVPNAVSTPTVVARYLVRCGATLPEALATVGAAQTAQFGMTVLIVVAVSITSGANVATRIDRLLVSEVLLGIGLVVGLVALLARYSGRVAGALRDARTSITALGAHVRARPGTAVLGLFAAAALTATHVAAFGCCVAAAGGHASVLAVTAVYLGGATAGSLSPTPGGTGASEAAMIGGLVAIGVPLTLATAATVLSRLVSVWLLVPPGWLALALLRRRALL